MTPELSDSIGPLTPELLYNGITNFDLRLRAAWLHGKADSDFGEKQHGLLVSAAAVFAEQGMDKASMAQIASHSGVSKALLYHYYPSKDSLIFAIIHAHLVELEASVAMAVDASLSPEAQPEPAHGSR